MIKLIYKVFDSNYRLVGFISEGNGRDYGEISNDKVTRELSLRNLIQSEFSNNQIYIKDGSIHTKGSFKINAIPSVMIQDGKYERIGNDIEITHRWVKNNINIGFEIRFDDGRSGRYSYENVIKLSDLFKPTNFVVRTKDGKRYISGKAGMSLNDLPATTIGQETTAIRTKPNAKENRGILGAEVNDVDILDLYDFIRNCGGSIILFNDSKYTAHSGEVKTDEKFIPLNIGEIGVPRLEFKADGLNINCNFRKPGYINIELTPGKISKVNTFIYRKKSLFYNGESYLNKIGIVVYNHSVKALIEKFASSLALDSMSEDDNKMLYRSVSDLLNIAVPSDSSVREYISIYSVDISKLGMIATSKLNSYILDGKTLEGKVTELESIKFKKKYLKSLIKGSQNTIAEKRVCSRFSLLSQDTLEILEANGIDLSDGSFSGIESKGSRGSSNQNIKIDYNISGINAARVTVKEMIEKSKKVPDFMIAYMERIKQGTDIAIVKEELSNISRIEEILTREVWMHKCAMYIKSGKTTIHQHDKDKWILDINNRSKDKVYKYNGGTLELHVSNIDI